MTIPGPQDESYKANMRTTRGTRNLKNVWQPEHIQEPPEDCVEERPSGTYVKSAWQVLQEYHQEHPGAVDPRYIEKQEERIKNLNDVLDNDFSTLDPPKDLSCWAEELEDGQVDRFVAGELSNLAGRDAMGRAEASRILYHLMKPGEEFKKGPSRWAHTAIEESIQYLGNWQHWESQDPHIGASTVKAHDKDPRAKEPQDHQDPWEPRGVAVSRGHDTPWSDWKHKDLWRDPEAPKPSSSSMRPQQRAQGGPPGPPPGPPPQQASSSSGPSSSPGPSNSSGYQ